MVWTAEVHHLEPDGLAVVVALLPKQQIHLNPSHGEHESPGTMPWKVSRLGFSWATRMPSFSIEVRYRRLMLLPPSMSMREKRRVCVQENTVGFRTRA
jgi:hypothetical protein